jgi:hypothetical protein
MSLDGPDANSKMGSVNELQKGAITYINITYM